MGKRSASLFLQIEMQIMTLNRLELILRYGPLKA